MFFLRFCLLYIVLFLNPYIKGIQFTLVNFSLQSWAEHVVIVFVRVMNVVLIVIAVLRVSIPLWIKTLLWSVFLFFSSCWLKAICKAILDSLVVLLNRLCIKWIFRIFLVIFSHDFIAIFNRILELLYHMIDVQLKFVLGSLVLRVSTCLFLCNRFFIATHVLYSWDWLLRI